WHISLSTWLRDYLYIPLGGSKGGPTATYKNLTITMLLGGLWHGAAWTFVLWGAYQGFLLMIHRAFEPLLKRLFSFKNFLLAKAWYGLKWFLFFQLVCLGWLFFRARSLEQVYDMLAGIFTNFVPEEGSLALAMLKELVFSTTLLLIVQIIQYAKNDLSVVYKSPLMVRAVYYSLCLFLLLVFGGSDAKEFIYFQF
ncbi:MAG: MBOAT family protein, partial [Planctomycetes bacterium]|nr:MBOAT family protein [Planctomycetota bacterium]